jgi:preprotein translocase subunit SecY
MLGNVWSSKEIRKKLFFVLLVAIVYRLGTHIPVPGIDITRLLGSNLEGSFFNNFYLSIVGGGFGTIFSLGIGPYITSSIIMQLLTVAIPKLEQIQKEGEEGRRKINNYTRFLAVFLAFVQAIGTVYSLANTITGNLFRYQNYLVYVSAIICMVTGTIFIMWLSEYLTEKGIGNGSSFIIFANILAGLPNSLVTLYNYAQNGDLLRLLYIVILLIIFILLIAISIWIQDGERRILVHYSKKMVGRLSVGFSNSFIPIKVNIAGVMSIIFAISLLQFPNNIYQLWKNDFLSKLINILSISTPLGAVLYIILIFCFTFFYTSFAMNPIEMAENMRKNGGFIPGIRSGKPTSDYIKGVVFRLSWLGAFCYSFIAMLPVVLQWIFKINIGFGGTSLLIVTGVALDIVKELESQLLMRNYKGFLS